MAIGRLIVKVYGSSVADPIFDAKVEILDNDLIYYTKEDGSTDAFVLDAPDIKYSLEPQHEVRPFSTYDIRVSKDDMVTTIVNNVEIFPEETAIQEVNLVSSDESNKELVELDLEDPVLWGDYAPTNYHENEEMTTPKISPKVLPSVVIPEYIIVHDGIPSNSSAANYYVSFPDYVKNVACSEIYSTWPLESIKANVLAIISFVLNRIYTEWYPSKGYSFTITSSTAYDQKYTYGRTLFSSITTVVDEIFDNYINFPGRIEPFLAQYRATDITTGQMSQWGSKDLAMQGYSALNILKYYYGNNLVIKQASVTTDLPSSFPGYTLKNGSCGEEVQLIQNQLNKIRGSYPAIPIITNADGQFNTETYNAVKRFQSVFGLTSDGIVGFATWYKISYVFTAVSKLTASITT